MMKRLSAICRGRTLGCKFCKNCGGCVKRHLETMVYQTQKEGEVRLLLEKNLGDLRDVWEKPVFVPDGRRRRASFTFKMGPKGLIFGFNENKSHQIEDVPYCEALRENINAALDDVRLLVKKLCEVEIKEGKKAKKIQIKHIVCGDLQITEAFNGLDIVLEADADLNLDHRFEIADFMNTHEKVIRFSFRKKHAFEAEPVIEKAKPFVKISGYDVFIAAGDFLQPSEEGEQALIFLVQKYAGQTKGKAADLFCGVGTFSYGLSALGGLNILAVDASKPLLQNFQKSVDAQMITNIKTKQQDLFLYPPTKDELENFDLVVADPPRAGAKALVRELCLTQGHKPEKIIFVSCNPLTFARDAKILNEGGYDLKKITMVDQFVYSDHSELVGLFTNEK